MFNCPIAKNKYKWFSNKYNIDIAIETGTCEGYGSLSLSNHHDLVITCEIDDTCCNLSINNFKEAGYNLKSEFNTKNDNLPVYKFENNNKKIYLIKGSSSIVLDDVLNNGLGFEVNKSILFYLDAHFNDNFPILDELESIGKKKLSDSKIIIHDFYVPGFTEYITNEYGNTVHNWGNDFCSSSGDSLDFDYVKTKLFEINPGMLSYFPDDVHNREDRSGRGILYSVPPEEQDFEEHLSYNRGIPCIEVNSNYYSNEDIKKSTIQKFQYKKLIEGVDY